MAELTIELGDEVETRYCDCCGRPYRCGCGFVFYDGDALATYRVNLYERHPKRRAMVLVTTDRARASREWTPGVSFLVEMWPTGDGIASGLRGPSDSPWEPAAGITGELLDREAALERAPRENLWEIVDFIGQSDPVLARHLAGNSGPHRRRNRWHRSDRHG